MIQRTKLQFFPIIVGTLLILLVWLPMINTAAGVSIGVISDPEWGDIRRADERINIRSGRSEQFRIVGKLNPGDKVKVDFLKENWYAIFDIDETVRNEATAIGYVYAPLLKPQKVERSNTPEKTQIVGTASGKWGLIRTVHTKVNIRDSRSPNSDIVGKLNPNDKIKADFLQNGWYAVFDPEETLRNEAAALGFVFAPLLKEITLPKRETETLCDAVWGKVITADKIINIHSERNNNSPVVGTLKVGNKLKVDFLKDDWYAAFDPEEKDCSEKAAVGYVFEPTLKAEPLELEPAEIVEQKEPEVEVAETVEPPQKTVQTVQPISIAADYVENDPTVASPKKWTMGIGGEYSILAFERQYDELDTPGDTSHSKAGTKLFIGYDDLLINISAKNGDWETKGRRWNITDKKYENYICGQDVEEYEIKLRSIYRGNLKNIAPYIVFGFNSTKFKDTKILSGSATWERSGTTIQVDDVEYKTGMLGVGMIIAFSDYLGIRGDISATFTEANETRDKDVDYSGSGVGSTLGLNCYWKLNKKLYFEAGTRYNDWNAGDEIGAVSKKDFVVLNIGYSIDF